MNRRRLALLAAAALIAIAGALYVVTQRNEQREAQGVLLLPALAAEMPAITTLSILKGSPTPLVTVHKNGTEWTVAERADYPADVGKLRKLLLELRDARIVEDKTADAARYAAIGVEDPTVAGATGVEVTVAGGSAKFSVIVGKAVGIGNFVRRAGEPQSYSVAPAIAVESEPRFWIDSRLIDAPPALIQKIEVKPAGSAAYSLHRLNPADNSFGLDGVPAGRKALDSAALAPGTNYTKVSADDVTAAAALDFSKASQATVTLSDGNVITLSGIVVGPRHWLQVSATKDAPLMAKTRGRAFDIASYHYEALFKPVEQLLVPKPAPGSKPPAVSPPPGSG